jgi:iron complex outermembrane receptor protein
VAKSDFTAVNSEATTSYEGGLKSGFLDNRLWFNVTGLPWVAHAIQLNGNDSNGYGRLFNSDTVKAYGMEAELRPALLLLIAGFSLLHTGIDDKCVYGQVCAFNRVLVCLLVDPTINVGANSFAQNDGNPLSYASPLQPEFHRPP